MTGPATVAAWTVHARDVPAPERTGFAPAIRAALGDRALMLETCHRVEAYALADPASPALPEPVRVPAGGRVLTGEDAVRHAIGVAVGADSVVVGEDQILHQLRVAVDGARAAGTLDPVLERLFSVALQAGRRARSWQQGPRRSLADLAIATIEAHRGAVRGSGILVVGAGEMGRLAVRAAGRAGASVTVTSRSVARAADLAADEGVESIPFDPGERVRTLAAVIVALRGGWPLTAATIEVLASGDAVVVDLSVPSAVPDELRANLGDRLVTADDLARRGAARDTGSSARLERLIDDATRAFLDWQAGHEARAAADALVRRSDRVREDELAALWEQVPDLAPEARAAIDAMARHLAGRLLREPLERLGRDADGPDGRAVRKLFAL